MRRFVILALVIMLLGHLYSYVLPTYHAEGSVFRGNIRVDSNLGLGAIRGHPRVVTGNNNLYIVWQDTRNGGSDIYYTRSSNQGVSFLLDVRVNDNPLDGTFQQTPDIATYQGNVYVVWDDGRAGIGSHEIYFAKSTDGFSFKKNVRVSGGGNLETNPSIAVDQNSGIIYVAWTSDEKTIRLARSLDGGVSFEPPVFVSDSTLYDRDHPDVAVDSTGKVYVVWSDMRLGLPPFWGPYFDVFIANSTDNGQSFGMNIPVNEVYTDALQFRPSLFIDKNDVLHVVWEDERSGKRDIYYARSSDGFKFGENVMVNNPYTHPRKPEIAHYTPSIVAHPSGNPIYVVWAEDRASNQSVYLAESTDGGESFHTAVEKNGGNYFFDVLDTLNGARNSNEAVILDNGNGIIDPGILNGLDSPDRVVIAGEANLQEDLTGKRLRYCDVNGNHRWDGDEDVVVDAGLNAGVILYPRIRPDRSNPADTTTGNFISYLRWDLRNSDSLYYVVEKNEKMVVGWFDVFGAEDESSNPEIEGLKPGDPISGVRIDFAYKTDGGYDGVGYMTWSESLVDEIPFFQISDTDGVEVYRSVDLYAMGVDSVEKLQRLNISFINDASMPLNVSFNSISLAVKRGLPDGYDIYDYVVYNGSVDSPLGMPLTNFTDEDNLMFVDGSGDGLYERGEPIVVTPGDVEPGGQIDETFRVLPRGDDIHWDAVMDPFPLNDDLANSWQESPSLAIDSSGEVFVVWRDRRHWPLSDAIYLTTTALDITPPRVTQCFPEDGSREVALDSFFSFVFSEPMQSDTTSYVNITPNISGLWTWNWDSTNLTFIPEKMLDGNVTYAFSLTGGKDRAGNILQGPMKCTFKTVEGPAIIHTPPEKAGSGERIEIIASISDNDTVANATIFYKNLGETFFSQTQMQLRSGSHVSGVWVGEIPEQPFTGVLSYYILAIDAVGNAGRSPAEEEHRIIISDNIPPSISHEVIGSARAGFQLEFRVKATDNINVFLVYLYIKPVGSSRFNPPIMMSRVGMGDEFVATVRLPNRDGTMYYYIEAVDGWGNKANLGNASSPLRVVVTGSPIDSSFIVWSLIFLGIGLLYLAFFIHYRKRNSIVEEIHED